MAYSSWYQCARGCDQRYSIYDVIYRCKDCGGLLDVVHDLEALADRSASEWKTLLEERSRSHDFPYGSGVWGLKEWISPQLDNQNVVSMYEGHTNLFRAERLGSEIGLPDLWLKLSGNSHTGSFKDLGMTVLVSVVKQIIADGKPIKAVAAASTGDTSAALAAYAAAAEIPAIVLLPQGKVSIEQLIQPIANGAAVLSLDTDFDGCMAIVQQLTNDPTIYLANSMNSLRMEGQKSVGVEIVRQFGWQVPDWIIIPSGNLGNISALGKGLQMMRALGLIDRTPRLVAAQAEHANPLYLSYQNNFNEFVPVTAQKTLASAIQIGNPVSYERAVKTLRSFDGIVEQVSEDELANAAVRADRTGLYACPHTGVALGALFKLLEQGIIQSHQRVVVISTAHGLKFSRFKVEYHQGQLDHVVEQYANPPIKLPADYGAVMDAINRRTSG
ncbi:MAG: threonine synthase [Chloroflexota bacterium]